MFQLAIVIPSNIFLRFSNINREQLYFMDEPSHLYHPDLCLACSLQYMNAQKMGKNGTVYLKLSGIWFSRRKKRFLTSKYNRRSKEENLWTTNARPSLAFQLISAQWSMDLKKNTVPGRVTQCCLCLWVRLHGQTVREVPQWPRGW